MGDLDWLFDENIRLQQTKVPILNTAFGIGMLADTDIHTVVCISVSVIQWVLMSRGKVSCLDLVPRCCCGWWAGAAPPW